MEAGRSSSLHSRNTSGKRPQTLTVPYLATLLSIVFLTFLYFGIWEDDGSFGFLRSLQTMKHPILFEEEADQSEKSDTPGCSVKVKPATPTPFTWRCTGGEKKKQIDAFLRMGDGWHGCVEPTHLYSFLSYVWSLTQQPITLVSIGANKGYDLVAWWEAWLPQSGINPESWGAHLRSLYPDVFDKYNFCGTCGDCKEHTIGFSHHDSINDEAYPNPLRIIGIEPSTSNFYILQQLQAWAKNSVLEVYNYAASNESGVAQFPVTRFGSATGSLTDITYADPNSNTTFKSTRVVTVDELVSELVIPKIDYLLIDAEGYDPLIIKGAYESLSSAKISMLEFEYHGIGPWSKTKLKYVLEFLEILQYDCYLKASDNLLVKLTDCFGDEYETHKWSNVVCVHRSHSLVNAFLLSHCHFLHRWLANDTTSIV